MIELGVYFYRIRYFREYLKKDCYDKVHRPNYSFRLDCCTMSQGDESDLREILKYLDSPTELPIYKNK